MTPYDFIFSDKKNIRIKRHFAFWGVYSFLVFWSEVAITGLKDFLNPRIYLWPFILLVLWLPLYIFSVYVFLNVLVPRFLQRKKYPGFIIAAFFVFGCDYLLAYLLGSFFMNYLLEIQSGGQQHDDSFISWGTRVMLFNRGITVTSVSLLATGIKLAKILYLQQIENTKLEKEKSENEIRIIKGGIQPNFLQQSLNTIHKKIHNREPDAPATILQFSELLSYILYDSREPFVPLKRELRMINLLVEMEKIHTGNQSKYLWETKGNPENKSIVPLQLFTQMQYALQQYSKQKIKQAPLKITILIEDDFITALLPENLINNNTNRFGRHIFEGINNPDGFANDVSERNLKINLVLTDSVLVK